MGRTSTIDLLPDKVRTNLIAWLEDPAIDYSEATERVNSLLGTLGLAELKVSRSAVSRKGKSHRESMDRLGKEMRQAKENRDYFYQQFGDDLSQDGGKFLAETLQAFIFKLNLSLNKIDGDIPVGDVYAHSKAVKNLTGSISQLEEALTKHSRRESEIKKQAIQESADKAMKAAKKGGLSAELAEKIRSEILGVK